MNRGLLLKSLRELLPVTALLGLGLFLVEMILQIVLPRVARQASAQMMQMPFAQNIIKAMLGTDTLPDPGPQLFLSIPWAHPVVLALVWAHAVIGATRLPAGEIDRGTIDILLGMPASRRAVYLSDTAAWALSGAAVLVMALAGNLSGGLTIPPAERARSGSLAVILVNLFALYLAVGGLAWLASAASDRRGKAMTIAFVAVLASFLLNYLAQLWPPMERFGALSVLRYYRPLYALREGPWPWRDIGVLAGTGVALWGVGAAVFARRDINVT